MAEDATLDRLGLLKANLGITGDMRDDYLKSILTSTEAELKGKGVPVADDDPEALMYLVDLSAWRWRNRGEGVMPRNLQYRLHNLQIRRVVTTDA